MEGEAIAKQIEGVYEMVLECAKKEFLEKGYKDASLRVIAQEAQTSTSSIYTRFGDKAGLFREIVEPVADGMKQIFLGIQEGFHNLDEDRQRAQVGEYSMNSTDGMLDYMYDHLVEFNLLLDSSEGTLYHSFVDELVDIEVEYTFKFMQIIDCDPDRDKQATEEFLHIIVTAYMNGMFEVIRHDMKRQDAKRYLRRLGAYHRAGFDTVFSSLKK